VDYGISRRGNIELNENKGNKILIIGDSRAGTALVPEILDKNIPGTKSYNLASRGGAIYGIINSIDFSGNPFKLVVICVSPVSMFGAFVHDSLDNRTEKVNLATPKSGNLYARVNLKLIDIVSRNFKFTYGFTELKNLVLNGYVSHYITSDGWESNIAFGSNVRYSRALNYYGYKNHLLCNSGDSAILEKFKNEFEIVIGRLAENRNIVLVRLPSSNELRKLENERFPWFDSFVSEVAGKNKIEYLNDFGDSYMSDPYNDGSHLSHFRAIRFSEMISSDLNRIIIH
jgi:hypothetical protein